MKELTVYSTIAGNLPTLVRNKGGINSPMCFVPYIEAYELQNKVDLLEAEIEELKCILEGLNK